MKVKEIALYLFGNIVIYREVNKDVNVCDMEFVDLYKGKISGIPEDILGMNVGTIGAKRKDVFDVLVR